jgi:F-type H+-transporting ATPase subunit epsilon
MYKLSIISQEKLIFEGMAYSLIAAGEMGYLEILSHHAPLATALQKGTLTVIDAHKKKQAYLISGGILEVSDNRCTVLVDSLESLELSYVRAWRKEKE